MGRYSRHQYIRIYSRNNSAIDRTGKPPGTSGKVGEIQWKKLLIGKPLFVAKISKSFVNKKGEVNKVIQDIDLEVYENEFVVLFGPGQCGKSTLIYIMAGLEAPSQGTVHIDNVLVEGPGPDRGVVYQETWLFPG